jgi:nucleoside-diphosphate-sugar epimerase
VRVLVTGSSGFLGSQVTEDLRRAGHTVVAYDIAEGRDVLDLRALRSAMSDCEAAVHLAAVVDPAAPEGRVLLVNLEGTTNVLLAGGQEGVGRIVFASSVDALGVFKGERRPDYLPLDEEHPCRPSSPYGMSKLLGEEMCRAFTDRTGIATICLRPPGIWDRETYASIQRRRREDPDFEWRPYWEYGAFLDIRDASSAVLCALTCPDPGHARAFLCSPDISTSGPGGRDLAARLLPDVPWRGGPPWDDDPFRALIDTRRAGRILGWRPIHTWKAWLEGSPQKDA